MEDADVINADVHKFDNFIWYGADTDFERIDDTIFTLNASASGVFDIDYTYESGDNKADIYVDGELYESPTVTFNYDCSQCHIMVVSDDCTVEKEIKGVSIAKNKQMVFKECALAGNNNLGRVSNHTVAAQIFTHLSVVSSRQQSYDWLRCEIG